MSYKHNMKDEKPPNVKQLISPVGWHCFQVLGAVEGMSKAQKPKFVVTVKHIESEQVEEIHPSAVPGKRWLLKQLLTACGIEAGKDGVYKWDVSDVKDKKVLAFVQHEPNSYIDRNGNEVKNTQHKLSNFKPYNTDDAEQATAKSSDEAWNQ